MMAYDYPHPVSRTYQYRKITKPLLERNRRARINRCLDELKDLMVDALETEGENISKLEKADILELTVRHLQRLHASRPSGLSSKGPTGDASESGTRTAAENRWQSGFGHCAAEACRYLSSLPGESGERLARHLASGLRGQGNPRARREKKNFSSTNHEICEDSRESETPSDPSVALSIDLRVTESPIEYARYESPISLNTDLRDETVIPVRDPDASCRDAKKLRRDDNPRETGILGSAIKIPKIGETRTRTEGRQYVGEDEEEIDVEGVDEGDPMWRPW